MTQLNRRLPNSEAIELLRAYRVRKDLVARNKFFAHNLPIVHHFAVKFTNPDKLIEYDDLYQEGCLGLLICMNKFDLDSGLQFSTYAMKSVRFYIANYAREWALIPIQRNFHIKASAWWRKKSKLRALLLREPSDEEIMVRFRWGKLAIKNFLEDVPIMNAPMTRLDAKFSFKDGDESLSFADIIPSKEKPTLDTLIERERTERLMKAVSNLQDRWQKVVVIRHGIDDGYEKSTLKNCAKMFGISKQRIQQIESRAFSQLRKELKEN